MTTEPEVIVIWGYNEGIQTVLEKAKKQILELTEGTRA